MKLNEANKNVPNKLQCDKYCKIKWNYTQCVMEAMSYEECRKTESKGHFS